MLGERARLELPLRMLLKTLYMSRGTDHSLWRPPCERDEEREPSRWLAPIERFS